MKILVVSWYMPPFNTMGALRVGKFCKYLDQQGHDVRVLAGDDLPYEQSLSVEIPKDRIVRTGGFDINAIPKAVQKLRVALSTKRAAPEFSESRSAPVEGGAPPAAPSSPPASPGSAERALRSLRVAYQRLFNLPDPQIGWYFSGVRGGWAMVENWKPDVIFASAPPFTSLMIGRALKKQTGAPLVIEYRDRFVEDPYATQPKVIRKRIETLLEDWWMKHASAIITVSEPWAEDYRARFGLPVLSVYNGFDPDDFPAEYPREPGDAGVLNIVYTGILYPERRDPTPLFKAIKLMGEDGKNVRISFYGASRNGLTRMAAAEDVLDHVHIHDQVPYQQSIKCQMNADILLLLQWNDPREQGNVPGKVFEYLGARRPVLGLGLEGGVPARILAERGAGVVVNDPARIAEHLREWLTEKRAKGEIPLLPLSAREGYSRPEQFERAEAFLKKAAGMETKPAGPPHELPAAHNNPIITGDSTMQITDVLGHKGIGVIALLPDTNISNAALLLSDQEIGVAAVVDEKDGLVGILSERDIMRGLGEHGAEVAGVTVDKLMTRQIISCTLETSVEEAIDLMRKNGIRHLPVVEDGNHLLAMISIRDLIEVQAEAYRKAG